MKGLNTIEYLIILKWLHRNLISDNVCFSKYLESEPRTQGKSLGPTLSEKSIFECQKDCDDNPNCNHIKFCGGVAGLKSRGCTLYDKVITKNTPTIVTGDNCSTSFKTCPGGISLINYELILR